MYTVLYTKILEPRGRMLSRWVVVNSTRINSDTNATHTRVSFENRVQPNERKLATRLHSHLFSLNTCSYIYILKPRCGIALDATLHIAGVNTAAASRHSGRLHVKSMG